jgi:hypothetical protein
MNQWFPVKKKVCRPKKAIAPSFESKVKVNHPYGRIVALSGQSSGL